MAQDWGTWIAAAAAGIGAYLFARTAGAKVTGTRGPGGLPRGKGVFITTLSKTGSPSELVKWCRDHDVSWCAIEIYWKDYGKPRRHHNGSTLEIYVAALTAANVRCWVWGFPSPDDVAGFVDRVRWAYATAPDVVGVIADPEKPYYGKRFAPQAAETMAGLVALGKPVGVTSYGEPRFHPTFPWQAWAAGASFGVPQIYSDRGKDYPAEATQHWKDVGFSRIIPALGGSSAHPPEEMARLFSWTPIEEGAAIWWSHRHLQLNDARARAVRDAVMPASGGARA